jgi:uncharacterized membrane protein YqjE
MNDAPDPVDDRDGWMAAAAEFVQARLDLVRHEAREAGRAAARRAAIATAVVGSAILFWLLLLAGLIGLVAAKQPGWTWWQVTLGIAVLHLLVAVAGVLLLRRPGTPLFQLTRSELAKDQEWLDRLKQKR